MDQLFTEDLLGNDALEKLNKLIDAHSKKVDGLITVQSELEKKAKKGIETTQKLSAARYEDQQAIRGQVESAEKLNKQSKKLNDTLVKEMQMIADSKAAKKKLITVQKLQAKVNTTVENSIERIEAELKLATAATKLFSTEQLKNTEVGQAAAAKIIELKNALIEYKNETDATEERTGGLTGKISELNDQVEAILPASLGAVSGLGKVKAAFTALIRNPVVAILAVIVGTLSLLASAFTRTEKGARAFEKASAIAAAAMDTLVYYSGLVFNSLQKAFENPIGALKSLGKGVVRFGDTLKNNLVTRAKGFFAAFKGGLKILRGAILDDTEAISQGVSEAAVGLNEFRSGLTLAEKEARRVTLQGTRSALKALNERLQRNIELRLELNELQRANIKRNRDLRTSIELLTRSMELNELQAGNTTISLVEQTQAAQNARNSIIRIANANIEIAQNTLRETTKRIQIEKAAGADITKSLDAQAAAYVALLTAKREFDVAIANNSKEQAELRQNQAEIDLDILIDAFDNQKTINEKLIANERLSFSERQKIQDETDRLGLASFNDQIAIIELAAGKQIDANSLIQESDARVLVDRLKALGISEKLNTRVLEIIRDRKSALSDLKDSQEDLDDSRKKSDAEILKLFDAANKRDKKAAKERFKIQQDYEKSVFELGENSTEDKQRFRIQQEKEALKELLRLNLEFNEGLSEIEKQTIKNRIAALNNELGNLGDDSEKDIFELLGIDLGDGARNNLKVFQESIFIVKEALMDLANQQSEIAAQRVEQADEELDASQEVLRTEIENRQAGLASSVETAQIAFRESQAQQEKALKAQESAQKKQQAIQNLEQISSLGTAIAKTFATFGFPAGLIPAGLLLGAFVASKVQASKAVKSFGDGGVEFIDGGGSHASGNDTRVSGNHSTDLHVEKDEILGVVKKGKAKKYKDNGLFKMAIDAFNKGVFEDVFSNSLTFAGDNQGDNVVNVDLTKTNFLLSEIKNKKSSNQFVTTNSKGQRVVVKGNKETTYV